MSAKQRQELLRRSWTQVADQYERHLVPRFMPWTQHTIRRFLAQKLPPGLILVPACGPGHELVMLANSFSEDRQIIGIDLAEGMVDLANARCKEAGISDRARAEQLPQAHLTLANWVSTLAPGGMLAVTFWPSQVEQQGPWQRLADLSTNKPKASAKSSHKQSVKAIHWEEQLPEVALKEGGMLLADEQPTFAMRWRSIEEFWQVMTEAGPWHARLLQMGNDHMALLRQQFMAGYPCPEHGPIEHFPHARLIMIQQSLAAL
ncbi:hypothetical protein WJX79_009042 [Trebouxia sp. C0005]